MACSTTLHRDLVLCMENSRIDGLCCPRTRCECCQPAAFRKIPGAIAGRKPRRSAFLLEVWVGESTSHQRPAPFTHTARLVDQSPRRTLMDQLAADKLSSVARLCTRPHRFASRIRLCSAPTSITCATRLVSWLRGARTVGRSPRQLSTHLRPLTTHGRGIKCVDINRPTVC